MVSKAKIDAQARYDKLNTKQILLKLNNKSDSDILEKLNRVDNKQGYIKRLIREDLKDDILDIESIKMLVLPVAKKFEIKKIYLFGSYARGEAKTDSDVDFLIDGGNYKGLFEYSDLVIKFKEALGKDVDIITTAALNEDKTASGIRFKENVKKDRIKLYENK